jgi:Tfp pilus assembly protein PilV
VRIFSPARHPGSAARTTAAFTIFEVMMGVIVMAFSISTSITVMQTGFRAVDSARNISLAAQIMQSEMEKIRLLDWTAINAYAPDPATTTTATLTIDPVFTSNPVVGSRFTLTRTTSTPQTNFKKITLNVAWTSLDGRPNTRSYTIYYGRYGLYDYYYNSV